MMRQLSQIVAKYPAASMRTKLSSGRCSLRNAQVASICHLSSKSFCWHHASLRIQESSRLILPTQGSEGRSDNKPHNSYGASFIAQQGRAMGIVSDIEKMLQIPRLGTALLAVLFGALLLMIPWLLNYLIAVGLIIWGIAEAVKASKTSGSSTST